MLRQQRFFPLWIFILSFFLFTFNLWNFDFLAIDTRFGLFLHETMERDAAFFPTLYGAYYPDYTSVPFFLMYFPAKYLFGGTVSMLTTVFPSALAGALTVMFTYLLGKRMFSVFHGLAAAFLLLASYGFMIMGRIVTIDMYTALCVVVALYCLQVAEERKSLAPELLFFPLIAFAFATRGPLGILIPAAVVPGWLMLRKKIARGFLYGILAAGMLVLLSWGMYEAAKITSPGFEKRLIEMQVSDRMGNSRPPYYYIVDGLRFYAPTFLFAIFAIVQIFRQYGRRFFRFALPEEKDLLARQRILYWFLIILIGLSIPGTKHSRYFVSAMPAAALLAALVFAPENLTKLSVFLKKWLVRLSVCVPAVFAGVSLIGWGVLLLLPETVMQGTLRIHVVFILAAMLILQILVLKKRKSSEPARLLAALAVLAVLMGTVRIAMDEPVSEYLMSSRELVKNVEALRPANQPLYFFMLGPDGDENKYMILVRRDRIFIPRYLHYDEDSEQIVSTEIIRYPQLAEEQFSMQNFPPDILILARRDRWEKRVPKYLKNRFTILCEGILGRRECILLTGKTEGASRK